MAKITLKDNPVNTAGDLPKVGEQAPAFTLTNSDFKEVNLKDYAGKQIILNIFPSIDTPTCSKSVRHFNELANQLESSVILCVSKDLPFAHKRFCAVEGLDNVISLSAFRHAEFGENKNYGVTMVDGPIHGLFSRAVVVIDSQGKITYTEQVQELANEPDYKAVLNAANRK